MGLSIRAYARHRGVTDTAVHKAIRSGRIEALADGTIDPDQADAQWARNTSSPKTGTQRPAVKVKVTMRKSYGFRTFRITELALYHVLGKLPEPQLAHRFY